MGGAVDESDASLSIDTSLLKQQAKEAKEAKAGTANPPRDEKFKALTIEEVRELIRRNTVQETMDARGETYIPDPDIMAMIDSRIDYPIFICDGNTVYTRGELLAHYPFEACKIEPESRFKQQEIGAFPAKKTAMGKQFEFAARDVPEKEEEFVMLEDIVGRATRANYTDKRLAHTIVRTKIFIGREAWENFKLFHRVAQGMPSLQLLMGSADRMAGLLMDDAGLAKERAQMAEQQRMLEEKQKELLRVQKEIQDQVSQLSKQYDEFKKAKSGPSKAKPAPSAAPSSSNEKAAEPLDDAVDL